MGTVGQLKTETTTPIEPSHEAVEVCDQMCQDLLDDIAATKDRLDELGKAAVELTGCLKAQLQNWIASREILRKETRRVETVVAQLRADQANLTGDRGGAT